MRIHSVRIDNFRCLRDFSLSFCDATGAPRPLTVLVGPNMSGKTTVLDALHLVYECVANARQPAVASFDAGSPMVRRDPNLPIAVDLAFSLHDGEWDTIDKLERLLDYPGLGTPNEALYTVTFRWPAPARSYFGVTESRPHKANLALRGRSTAKVAKSRRLVGEGVFEQVGGMLYLDQHRSVEVGVPSTNSGPEEQVRERAGSREILPWLELASRLDQKWDEATQGVSAWKRVKRLYAELAAPAEIDDVKAFDEGFDLRLRRGETFYYSAGLSSGERQVLRFVVNLVAARALRSVVLIDELELHLHPRWQRNLLHFCRHGGGGDNQFIVTTHSSSLLDYIDPADVVRLGGEL